MAALAGNNYEVETDKPQLILFKALSGIRRALMLLQSVGLISDKITANEKY